MKKSNMSAVHESPTERRRFSLRCLLGNHRYELIASEGEPRVSTCQRCGHVRLQSLSGEYLY